MPLKNDVLRLLDEDAEQHIAFLSSLIKIPSPNPPGDTQDAIRLVQKYLSERSIESEIIAPKQTAPNIVSTVHGQRGTDIRGSRRLILNGHIDHFPCSSDEDWERDPYSGDITDNFVHGLGGVDMKAGTVASIIAFSYVNRFLSEVAGHCTLEVVSDEETGGRYGTRYLIEQDERKEEWRGDCLNAEPSGIESIRFAEKGTLRMTFEITGPGGHGAYIHRAEGAIRTAVKLIDRLLALELLRGEGMDQELREYLEQDDVRRVADQIMGDGAADKMLSPTVNIGTIRGGVKVNMIPSYCTFEADIRLPIGLTKEMVLDKIQEMMNDFPGTTFTVQEAASNVPTSCAHEHELVSLIQSHSQETKGVRPLAISSLGATDCKHFRRNGIPAYAYGVRPDTMAQKNERVKIEEFLHIVNIHTLVALDYLGALKSGR